MNIAEARAQNLERRIEELERRLAEAERLIDLNKPSHPGSPLTN